MAGGQGVTGPIRLEGVMAVRAAGWHSDVFVSHRITRQTHGAGVGRLRGPGAPNAPAGHTQSSGLAFSVPSGASAPGRKDEMKLDLLTFQMFRRDQYISSREQLLQLSHTACRRGGCLFIRFRSVIFRTESKRTRRLLRFFFQSVNLFFTGHPHLWATCQCAGGSYGTGQTTGVKTHTLYV